MQAHRLHFQLPLRSALSDSLGLFTALSFQDGSCSLQSLGCDYGQVHVPQPLGVAFLRTVSDDRASLCSSQTAASDQYHGELEDTEFLNKSQLFVLLAVPNGKGTGIQLQAWECIAVEDKDRCKDKDKDKDNECPGTPFLETSIQLKANQEHESSLVSLASSVDAGCNVSLDLPPEPFLILKASINVVVIYSPAISQVWLLCAKALGKGKISLSLCSVIQCTDPSSEFYLAPQYLLQGVEGGIRIWELGRLIRNESSSIEKIDTMSADSKVSDEDIAQNDDDNASSLGLARAGESHMGNVELDTEIANAAGKCLLEMVSGVKIAPANGGVNGYDDWHSLPIETDETALIMKWKLDSEQEKKNEMWVASGHSTEFVFIPMPDTSQEFPSNFVGNLRGTIQGPIKIEELSSIVSQERGKANVVSFQSLGGDHYLVLDSRGCLHVIHRIRASPLTKPEYQRSFKQWELQSLATNMSVSCCTAFPLQPSLPSFGSAFEGAYLWFSDGALTIHVCHLYLQFAETGDEALNPAGVSSSLRCEVERIVMAEAPVKLLASFSPFAALAGFTGSTVLYVMEGG